MKGIYVRLCAGPTSLWGKAVSWIDATLPCSHGIPARDPGRLDLPTSLTLLLWVERASEVWTG